MVLAKAEETSTLSEAVDLAEAQAAIGVALKAEAEVAAVEIPNTAISKDEAIAMIIGTTKTDLLSMSSK